MDWDSTRVVRLTPHTWETYVTVAVNICQHVSTQTYLDRGLHINHTYEFPYPETISKVLITMQYRSVPQICPRPLLQL